MRVGVFVLVLVLVGRICCLVGPLSEVEQGAPLELILGYSPLELERGGFFWCGIAFFGVGTCGGAAMLKISASLFRATVWLLPNIVIWLVGFGFRRAWAR